MDLPGFGETPCVTGEVSVLTLQNFGMNLVGWASSPLLKNLLAMVQDVGSIAHRLAIGWHSQFVSLSASLCRSHPPPSNPTI
ncbi:hypothetical protein QUA82_05680 [Microcoleus sp. F8-D3]